MKRFIILAALATVFTLSCSQTKEEDGGSNAGGRTEKEVDNSSIDPEVFTMLDSDNSSLNSILTEYGDGKYYYAAYDLLKYFRGRTGIVDSEINLIATTITEDEQTVADRALSESIDTLVRRPQLDWIAAQGLAYRVSRDEKYASAWVSTMDRFLSSTDALLNWSMSDAEIRLGQMTSAWEYFLQSKNLTPAFSVRYLAFICKDARKLSAALSAKSDEGASVLGRIATVFPEFADAASWKTQARESGNSKYSAEWFQVLNLDAAGLSEVKAKYAAGDYAAAAAALLKYWRSRDVAVNPNVNLSMTSISDEYQRWADMALKENGYRFYVKNYYENAAELLPYSYLASDGTSINWQYWPTKDQEQRYQVNRHEWMLPQAEAYYVSGNEKYVQSWMEVYQDWFKQNPEPTVELDYSLYPENQAAEWRNAGWTWRPLEVAIRLMDQCSIAEYTKKSSSLTPEYLAWFLYEFSRQADHIRKHYSETSNHLITQAQGVATAGLLFPEMAESSEWIKSGSDKLNNEVTAQYYSDGWLKDGDFHYHISSIEDFRSTMVLAEKNGKADLFPSSYKTAMKAMADVVVNMTYPDFSTVNMTDTRCDTWTKSVLQKNFARYAELFPEESYYSWMATSGTSGTKPSNLSKNFPDCGYYVLRSGWDKNDMMMVLQNTTTSPNEQWHRQWDNNTFELYVAGRKIFQDSGCYTYTTGTNRSKYAATSAHNTLTLDGGNVTTCRGKMLASKTDGQTDILVLSNASYSGLTHRRSIFFVDRKFFVIVDEGYGTASGTVNLNFHLPPVSSSDSDVTVDAEQNGAHTSFADGNNIVVRTFSPSSISTTARTGFLSTNIDKTVARKSYQVDLVKTSGMAAARFITVLLPSSNPAAESISASFPSDFSESSVAATVTVDSKTYDLKINLQ